MRRQGFTLIELLVVLVVISIFTGLIVGEMRGSYEDALLRSSARKLINACNLAASESVAHNIAHRLMIDTVNHRFAIRPVIQEDGSKPAVVEEDRLDSRITIQVREAEQKLDPEEEQAPENTPEESKRREEILFNADGTADAREILLRDRTGVEMLLRINPVTARVRVVRSESGGGA